MTTANELARLEQIDDLRLVWKDEAQDFTPWLAQPENLAVLSEALNMELETEGQEERVGPFRADILCRDMQDDSLVLIENQLERTDHNHLGQLLTYAAGLQTVTIIWVARTFTDEHRAALDWLNEITDERFRFFGLEIELWRIADSPAAPKFNIVSRPNDWASATQSVATGEISASGSLHLRFWTRFCEYLREIDSPVKPPTSTIKPFISYRISKGGFSIGAYRSTRYNLTWVDLRITAPDRIAYFGLLMEMKDDIESEIGRPLDWRKDPGLKASHIRSAHNTDPTDEADWNRQMKWLDETLQAFFRVLPQRVQKLDLADWQPDDESYDE